jgi:hypothetical protein
MNSNLKNNKCAHLKTKFQNIEINSLNQEINFGITITDLFSGEISSNSLSLSSNLANERTNNKLYWTKFDYESEIVTFCKLCHKIHSTFNQIESKMDLDKRSNLNLIERINITALFKLNSSIVAKKQDKNEEFKKFFLQLKEKLETIEQILENFIDFSNNYELKLSKNCDLIKKQILNSVESRLVKELSENRSKLISELNNYQQKCIQNIDIDNNKWNNFKSFLNKHQIDGKTVSYYLNQESSSSDDSLIEEINFFKAQLDEKLINFNFHLFLDKKVVFQAKISTDLEQHLSGLVNFTEFMPKFKQDLTNKISVKYDKYDHLKSMFIQKKSHLHAINYLDFGENMKQNKVASDLSCHLIGSTDELLICSRYTTKSNSSIYTNCDLFLYNLDGELIRQANIANVHVRLIATNVNFILLTAEYEQKLNFSINKLFNCKSFDLNLYNMNLEQVKSIKVESNLKTDQSLFYPQCLFMDKDKIYFMKNVAPFISVYDLDLNLIGKFGQNFSKQFSYYLSPINVKHFRTISNKLYLQRVNSDLLSSIVILDLFTGITLKKINIPIYHFANFYITRNEIIFLENNANSIILYNTDNEVTVSKIALKELGNQGEVPNEERDTEEPEESKKVIDSYCLTSSGYVVALFKEKSLIGIY